MKLPAEPLPPVPQSSIGSASYGFYINGPFVGSYSEVGPATGRIGVFMEGTGQKAAFSDLADYPVLPPNWRFPA